MAPVGSEQSEAEYPVAANTTICVGSIVSVNAMGYAVPAAANAVSRVVGVALERVDNSGGRDGDKTVRLVARKICVLGAGGKIYEN